MDEYKAKYPGAQILSNVTKAKKAEAARRFNSQRDYSSIGEKISATKKERFASGELVVHNTGRPMSQEQKDKLSKIRKEQFASGELVHWNTGKKHSEETKEKIRNALKGFKVSDETREKLRIASKKRIEKYGGPMLGKHLKESDKEKLRIIAKDLSAKRRKQTTDMYNEWLVEEKLVATNFENGNFHLTCMECRSQFHQNKIIPKSVP
jgi:uncharacterized membrane protein